MSKFNKEEIGGIIFVSLAVLFAMGLGILGYDIFYKDNISSPVEEMYHKQLVVTLDSILDARFGTNYYKEVIINRMIRMRVIIFNKTYDNRKRKRDY